MIDNNKNDERDSLQDDARMEGELCEAVREAILDHKLRGDPIAIAENGHVVWIPADQIVIPSSTE